MERLKSARLVLLAVVALSVTCVVGGAGTAWAWGDLGHQVAAIIAADHLTPTARAQVAKILHVAPSRRAVSAAMAAASLLPDHRFRDEDPATRPWHFIDLCLQDSRAQITARCPAGACVSAKISEYERRLKRRRYDAWGASGDLAFLIHFVADAYQPLHAATNEDLGGNCVRVRSRPRARDLHDFWDNGVVEKLGEEMHAQQPTALARALERAYPDRGALAHQAQNPAAIVWRSHELALDDIYKPLRIRERPCVPIASCRAARHITVRLSRSYVAAAAQVAGRQLTASGYNLAAMLNRIWPAAKAH